MNPQILHTAFNTRHTGDISLEAARTYVRAAGTRCQIDLAGGLAALNDIFGSGWAPAPALDGRYRGAVVAVAGPGAGRVMASVRRREDWLGQVFDGGSGSGENWIDRTAVSRLRWLTPSYRGYRPVGAGALAFPFRTSVGPGATDPRLEVLRLDYAVPGNPRLAIPVRRMLDEIVQVAEDYYLGRAYVSLPRRGHWLAAYFTLSPDNW